MIENSQPAHAFYGEPVSGRRLAATSDARMATASAPYVGRGDKCAGNNDTCGANKVRGQELCAGHLKQAKNIEQISETMKDKE